jgi:predicted amino acid dehydrogenase
MNKDYKLTEGINQTEKIEFQNTNKTKNPIVSMISNCLSDTHRDMIRKQNNYLCKGVLNPLEFSYNGINGIIPLLDIIPEDIFTSRCMKTAKDYFINAVRCSIDAGAKVILLAASTKRLFGNGSELKAMFPDTLFTIGDNGTALAFLRQIDYVTKNISIDSPILVLGAGFLGETAISHLKRKGYQKVIIISRHKIKGSTLKYHYTSIDEYRHSVDFEGASIMLVCAHNHDVQTEQLDALIRERLIILDVAVPKAIPLSIISSLNGKVKRFDGGDFEIKNLKLNFTPQHAGLNFEGEFYGCFTESLLLALSNYKGNSDFFQVSDSNMDVINTILKQYNNDFFISMKNFGQTVAGYDELLPC